MKELFHIICDPWIQATKEQKLYTILFIIAVLLTCTLAEA